MKRTYILIILFGAVISTTSGLSIPTKTLSNLKSGSDIRGTFSLNNDANSGGQSLTPAVAYQIGSAFALTVGKGSTIMMGRDPRPHGGLLSKSFAKGCAAAGCVCLDAGIATTPSMFHAVRTGEAVASVMITASHLPRDKNGFKMFGSFGGSKMPVPLSSSLRDELLAKASEVTAPR